MLCGIAIVVIVGSIYATYAWQHRKVDNLSQQITQLKNDLLTAMKRQPPTIKQSYISEKGVGAKVYVPAGHAQLASPVIVMGEVPGNWSFEANFPVKLLDAEGNVVAEVPAQLMDDWMTDKLVSFSAKLIYDTTLSGDGTLVLQRDNPSGLAENDDSITIPVKL